MKNKSDSKHFSLFSLNENELVLSVKKAPLFVRAVIFLLALISLLLPLVGLTLRVASGDGFHFGFLLMMLLFGAMGFYLLRLTLWNTYGKETIHFTKNKIEYLSDYGWFKGTRKQLTIESSATFSIQKLGYEDDQIGTLVISENANKICCATKQSLDDLSDLIIALNALQEKLRD